MEFNTAWTTARPTMSSTAFNYRSEAGELARIEKERLDLQDLVPRPRYRRHSDPQYEAIRVGPKDPAHGQAPYLFTTGPWRGQTVHVEPHKMDRHLSVAAKYYQCSACGQLIVPGELYRAQVWAPWECHPDGDKTWLSQPACRWCAEGYWKDADIQDDCWEEAAWEWASTQADRWLEGFPECWEVPIPGWSGCQLVDEVSAPLRAAQRQANAFMAFLRRFAKHAKPATIRRIGPALLACGFQRGGGWPSW